jgi:hypothetical protein
MRTGEAAIFAVLGAKGLNTLAVFIYYSYYYYFILFYFLLE